MIISHKYKFIFIKTRKTAGTSIELFLSNLCADKDIITPIFEHGSNLKEYKNKPQNYQEYFNPIPEIIKYGNAISSKNNHYRLCSSNPIKDFLKKRQFYNHIPAFRVRERIPPKIWQDYYKFCFERNPWDKTISHFYFMNGANEKQSFEEYISGNSFPWNYPLYTNPLNNNEIIVDYVAKYENLTAELTRIFDKLNIPFDGELSVRAKGKFRKDKRPYQEVFSNKHRDLIEEKFSQEIKLHGFTFN